MISSSVPEEHGDLALSGRLSVQRGNHVPHEHHNHVAVGVGLRQGVVDLAVRVQGRDDGDPRVDLFHGDRRGR